MRPAETCGDPLVVYSPYKVNVVNGASSTSLAARTAKWAPIERSRRDNSNGENRSSLSHSSQELQAVEIAVTRGSRDQGVHAERSAIIPHDDFRLFTLWRDHFFLHALVWVPLVSAAERAVPPVEIMSSLPMTHAILKEIRKYENEKNGSCDGIDGRAEIRDVRLSRHRKAAFLARASPSSVPPLLPPKHPFSFATLPQDMLYNHFP